MTTRDVAGVAQPGHDDVTTLIDLARRNLRLLSCLVLRYEVDRGEIATEETVVRGPADVVGYLGPELADLAQEQLRTVLLDTKNRVLGTCLVYHGGLNSIVVRLADCFREAVRRNAAAILLVHNHPSHDPEPSPEDVRVTREAAQVGELLGIDLLDHVIVGGRSFVSLRERGFYRPPAEKRPGRNGKSAHGDRPCWEIGNA